MIDRRCGRRLLTFSARAPAFPHLPERRHGGRISLHPTAPTIPTCICCLCSNNARSASGRPSRHVWTYTGTHGAEGRSGARRLRSPAATPQRQRFTPHVPALRGGEGQQVGDCRGRPPTTTNLLPAFYQCGRWLLRATKRALSCLGSWCCFYRLVCRRPCHRCLLPLPGGDR